MWMDADRRMNGFSERPRILVFAPHTRIAPGRSGIHRVVMRLIEHLPRYARVDLVKWDDIEGQLRYCDRADMRGYFDGVRPPNGIEVHPLAHRIEYRFADTLASEDKVIVLMPEVFHLGENGNEVHARVIAQSIVSGWTTAAIFYDLIPLKGEYYPERDAHAQYLAELARTDIVLPISRFVENDLRTYWRDTLGLDTAELAGTRQRVKAIPLADRDRTAPSLWSSARPRDTILMLGTIEPRKQQVRVIRAFQKLRLAERAGLRLALIGGINPQAEVEFRRLITTDPNVTWLGRASDALVDEAFATARFSVFASLDEGFGLPIVESLCRDVPCLSAHTGAMREVAAGGGCLLVDVRNDAAIEAGLERLAFDDTALEVLRGELQERPWRSWDDYARELVAVIGDDENPRSRARSTARLATANLSAALHHAKERRGSRAAVPLGSDNIVIDLIDGTDWSPRSPRAPQEGATHAIVVAASVDPARLSQPAFNAITRADAWFCCTETAYETVVARAATSGFDGLLSGCCGWSTDPEALAAMVEARLATLGERHARCRITAARDAIYRTAWARSSLPAPDTALTLVISTYNGAAFIERNITHTLGLMRPLGGRVRLVVVDNASTDDTPQRLAPFVDRGEIESIRVPCNTGLLGNLHHVSTLFRARHVWTIGVDDIIIPGALERIIEILEMNPACPFIMPNFAALSGGCDGAARFGSATGTRA